jgi:hypothetical protein
MATAATENLSEPEVEAETGCPPHRMTVERDERPSDGAGGEALLIKRTWITARTTRSR